MGMNMESIDKFMERLASSSPAPGGGAASSMVALVGSSLNSMVAGLTLGKKGYDGSQKIVERIAARSSELNLKLRELMEEDEGAFNLIVAAWKMPKSSDEEKKARDAALQDATRKAIAVPWRIASVSREILEMAAELVTHGNRNAVTDAGCSLEFSMAAIKGVFQNIKINLKSLSDQDKVDSEKLKMKLFLEDCQDTFHKAMKELEAKL